MIFELLKFKKIENKKTLKPENLINFTELHEFENMNFTKQANIKTMTYVIYDCFNKGYK